MALAKAVIEIVNEKEVIPVMFNPSEYKISKQVNYTNIDIWRIESKIPVYENGEPKILTLELFFDIGISYELEIASQEDGVRKYTEKIMKLTSCGKDEKPPLCSFKWGKLIFTGYVASIDESFTRFDSNGVPIRAVLNLSMVEFYVSSDNKDLVDTIEMICDVMGNTSDWREIVPYLDIINPRKAF